MKNNLIHQIKFFFHKHKRLRLYQLTVLIFSLYQFPAFAYDSTQIQIPNADDQVLCPIQPDLQNRDQCILVSAPQLQGEVRSFADGMGFYKGVATRTSSNALCNNRGVFSIFYGFINWGFVSVSGVNGVANYVQQRSDYFCCRSLSQWMPAKNCNALT